MNPTGIARELEPSPRYKIEEFVTKLRENNIFTAVRYTQGDDIAAACGQLAIKSLTPNLSKGEGE
jgi:23S rRNA (adenine2503-C2)-methyltransferase